MTVIIESNFHWMPFLLILGFLGGILCMWAIGREARQRRRAEERDQYYRYKPTKSVYVLLFTGISTLLIGLLGGIWYESHTSYQNKMLIESGLEVTNISGPNGGGFPGCYSDMSSYSTAVTWNKNGEEFSGLLESYGNPDNTCTYVLKPVK